MLPKAHLTSHSRVSGSRWVITPSWLSQSLRSFCIVLPCILATFSACHLLLLLGPYHFCPSLCLSLHENFLGISNFLEEISSLSHSVVFLYFFALITDEGFIISPCYSLELCIQMGISSFSPLPSLLFFSQLFVFSSDNHFAFLHFFFLGMVLIPASCTVSWTSVHTSSGTLSDLIPWIYLPLPLYNLRNLI